MLKPLLAGLLVATLASGAVAAEQSQVPPPPSATHAAPGTGGTENRGGGATVLGLQPDEVRASQVRNSRVMSMDGLELGSAADMLIDKKRHAADLVGLQTSRAPGKSEVAIPWSSLHPATRPGAGYVADLSPQAIASAPSFTEAAQSHPDYVSVEHDVIGRKVQSKSGQDLGTAVDVVVRLGTGTIDYLLVHGGVGLGTGNQAQAVPWKEVAQLPKEQQQAITLGLDQQQLAETPFFGLKAEERPQEINPQRLFDQVPSTGSSQKPLGTGTVVK